ncbi:hypothetical protein NG782_10220 [Aliarcobacter cryaerophilus]
MMYCKGNDMKTKTKINYLVETGHEIEENRFEVEILKVIIQLIKEK